MKINYLAALVMCTGVNYFAQGQTAWNLTGNSVSGTDFLGTTNNQPFRLGTYNTTTPQPILFQTGGAVERMRITETGLVGIGIIPSPNPNFHALLTVAGPIRANAGANGTVLFSLTSAFGIPAADGFRMKNNLDFFGAGQDALVFEKADYNDGTPDGGIAFTNTGVSGTEIPAFYIRGTGRTYVGRNILSDVQIENRFVIDSEPGDASLAGLRFMDLTTAATPITNPGSGVLGVDNNGNVIYVEVPSGGIGNYCSATANPLIGNYQIPLSNYSYNFTAGGSDGRVNIGNVACGLSDFSRLSVVQNTPMTFATTHSAIMGYTDGTNLPDYTASISSYGIVGKIQYAKNFVHAGVYGESNNAMNPTAWSGETIGVGVWGTAQGNDINIGVKSDVSDINAGHNYGIYSSASGAIAGNWAFWGAGDYFSSGAWNPSDENLKENISNLLYSDSILSQLIPKRYTFKTDTFSYLNLQNTPQVGFLAQELEDVLPEAVKEVTSPAVYDSLGNLVGMPLTFKAVSYEKLIPVLVGGHNEQKSEIDSLKAQNRQLQNQIDDLNEKVNLLISCIQSQFPEICEVGQRDIQMNSTETQEQLKSRQVVTLADKNTVILNQNVPNPFAESTVITYSIPENVANAQIVFHDSRGAVIKSIDVQQRGKGTLDVYANDLSSGTYTYTLIIDGKTVMTKRMLKQ